MAFVAAGKGDGEGEVDGARRIGAPFLEGSSPPEHLLRATAPGGSAMARLLTAIGVSGFKSKITFAGFAQTCDLILETLEGDRRL